MDIGEELGDERDKVAEMVAPIALLADSARFYAGVPQVDHAVLGEATDKPSDIQDAALRRVVGVPDDCFVVVRHISLQYFSNEQRELSFRRPSPSSQLRGLRI